MFNSRFDELKEVKHFKEITDFKNLITQNTELKSLQSLQNDGAFLWLYLTAYYQKNTQ